MKTLIKNYINNEDGLVTLEWVGIAAVVVVAGILIAAFVMEGADGTSASINAASSTVADAADTAVDATTITNIGNGVVNP